MTSRPAERTKSQLQEEAKQRGVPASGTKAQLAERLEETGGPEPEQPRPKPRELARRAEQQLTELVGRKVDAVSGLSRSDDGWHVTLEVVELPRVPIATDVLGSYEVVVDGDGTMLGYERTRRYLRGQAREE